MTAGTEARELWSHAWGDLRGYIGLFAGKRVDGQRELANVEQQYYPYPDAAGFAESWLAERSERGLEVYACAHLLTAKQRTKANAADVLCLWTDGDGAAVPPEMPQPTLIVESSPGRNNYYWRLCRPIPPEQAESLNKRLAAAIGADAGGYDLSQLLRVPGMTNYKYPNHPVTRLLSTTKGAYEPDELAGCLPPEPESRAKASGHEQGDTNDEPPVRLDVDGLRWWTGERCKLKDGRRINRSEMRPGDEIDRSETLFMIGLLLARAGLTRKPWLIDALRDRDSALELYTYDDRPREYERIADKALSDARNTAPFRPGMNGHKQDDIPPDDPSSAPPEPQQYNLTDLGNARRLVAHHGHGLRYCHPWHAWYVWDGRRWARDTTGEVMRRAKATIATIYDEAASATDDDERKRIGKWALASETSRRLTAMVELAASEPGIPIMPDDMDTDPWLVTVENGTIDLRTGTLRAHDQNDLITRLMPTTYSRDADCPRFLAFLDRIMNDDQELIGFIQRALGYSLTASTREQVIFILHGSGANGKTTLVRLILDLMSDYAKQIATETLLVRRNTNVPNDVAALRGARLSAAVEADDGRRLSESLVKQLTGNDRISARFLYGEWFEFSPTAKFWLATNHKPVIRGTDNAIWRRIRLIPFAVTIPPDEQDPDLAETLRTEMPGILAWIVRGCLSWQRDGLGNPDAVRDATEEYRSDMDVLGSWIADRCVTARSAKARASELYRSYHGWCEAGEERPLTQTAFGRRLAERGYVKLRENRGMTYQGIGLRTEGDSV